MLSEPVLLFQPSFSSLFHLLSKLAFDNILVQPVYAQLASSSLKEILQYNLVQDIDFSPKEGQKVIHGCFTMMALLS